MLDKKIATLFASTTDVDKINDVNKMSDLNKTLDEKQDEKRDEKVHPTKRPNNIAASSTASSTSWSRYVQNTSETDRFGSPSRPDQNGTPDPFDESQKGQYLEYLNNRMRRNSPRVYNGTPRRLVEKTFDYMPVNYAPNEYAPNKYEPVNYTSVDDVEEINDSQIMIIREELSRYKAFLLNRRQQCQKKMAAKCIAHLCMIVMRACAQHVEIISSLQNDINQILYFSARGQKYVDEQCGNIKVSLEIVKTYMEEVFDDFIVEKEKVLSYNAEQKKTTNLPTSQQTA